MKWYNILILIGLLGLFAVGFYWYVNVPTSNGTIVNNTVVKPNYKYKFVVGAAYGSKICPYKYPSFNNAVLVDKNGKPLNDSLIGKFVGMDGHYAKMKLPTCICDSYYSSISKCKVGEQVYENMTVFVVSDYKVMNKTKMFECKTNADCVPATCCHATSCVNKAYAPNCTKVICTMSRVPGTLDYGHCGCVDGACQAIIENPISIE